MAEGKSDRGAKDEIKKGMSEAGKDAAVKTRKEGGKGTSGSDQISEGMSEAGSGSATTTSSGGDLSGRPIGREPKRRSMKQSTIVSQLVIRQPGPVRPAPAHPRAGRQQRRGRLQAMSDKALCLPLVVALSWLGLSGAWGQTDQALPPVPPEVQGEPVEKQPAGDGAAR